MKSSCLVDISRFRVPTFERMKTMLANIKSYGYEQVFFNIEHTFKIESHPLIGSEADGFTDKQFRELDSYAAELDLELIPVFQSLGHLFHTLKWKKYQHLSETEHNWSLAIGNEESYELLDSFYKVVASTFRSDYIHIGTDEVYDLLDGQSRHLLESGRTKFEYYIDHILRLKDMAAKYGKKIMIWGDMLEKAPEVLEQLGDDVIICYWNYGLVDMHTIYGEIDNKVYVCPATQSWISPFIRVNFAIKNMQKRYENCKQIDAYGFMITDWGDGGHLHPLSFTEKMFEMGIKIYDGEKEPSLDLNSELMQDIVNALDAIHFADYLNYDGLIRREKYFTRLLFHEYIFHGEAFLMQSDEQLDFLLNRCELLRELADRVDRQNLSDEFEEDLLLFVDHTLLLAEKVSIHCDFRKGLSSDELGNKVDKLIYRLREWFSRFTVRWISTCQPMGLYFHYHYMKQQEMDLLSEVRSLQGLKPGYDYSQIEKITVYGDPGYDNMFLINSFAALNRLWDDYRL